LGRLKEATALIKELKERMSRNNEHDEDDRKLVSEAKELMGRD